MRNKNIDLYFFSGTGNTYQVAKKMQEVFIKNKCTVNLFRMEKIQPASINTDNTIGFAFPVAFQSTYPFIWKFFSELPTVNGTEVFVVDTMGIMSGGVIGPLKSLLKRKGYYCIGAKEIVMPSNFRKSQKSEKKIKEISAKGIFDAQIFAHDLVYNQTKWIRIPFLSDVVKSVSSSGFVWNSLKKHISPKLDEVKCIKCGLCYRLCPVDNINMHEFPDFGDNCQYCQRCFAYCPTGAIYFKGIKLEKYKNAEVNEVLLEKKS
ncbi:MAG: EFR1 family ferrodoxin [Candidatus Cloacimonetes bacterium]|nr:EFR1 family ferrodoxin [Candidatus Cloacimonadota bacterium]